MRRLHLAVVTISFALYASFASASTIKAWEFSSNAQGWTGVNLGMTTPPNVNWYSSAAHPGVIYGTPTNSDPQMLAPTDTAPLSWSITASAIQSIDVNIRSDGSGTRTCRLYWRASGQSFDQSRSLAQTYTAFVDIGGTGYQVLSFNVGAESGWQGTIVQLRIDPSDVGTYTAYPVYVDYVRIQETPTAPPAPSGLDATDGTYSDKIQVSWNSVSGASSYQVWRSPSYYTSDAAYLGNATTNSYNDYSAVAGQYYYYFAKSTNSYGTSGFSGSFDYGHIGISIPSGVTASDGTYSDRVHVSWNSVTGATSYDVYRSTTNNSGTAAIAFQTTGPAGDDTEVAPNTTYYYWVKALNSVFGDTTAFSASDSGYAKTFVPVDGHYYKQSTGAVYIYQNGYMRLFSAGGTGVDSGTVYARVRFGDDNPRWSTNPPETADDSLLTGFYQTHKGPDIFKTDGFGNGSVFKAASGKVTDPSYPDIVSSTVFELAMVNGVPKWKYFISSTDFHAHRASSPHNESGSLADAEVLMVSNAQAVYDLFGGGGAFYFNPVEGTYYKKNAGTDTGVYLYQNGYLRLFSAWGDSPVSSAKMYSRVRFGGDDPFWSTNPPTLVDPSDLDVFYQAHKGPDIFKPDVYGDSSAFVASSGSVSDPNYPAIVANTVFEIDMVDGQPKWFYFANPDAFYAHRAEAPHNETASVASAKLLHTAHPQEVYNLFGGAGPFGASVTNPVFVPLHRLFKPSQTTDHYYCTQQSQIDLAVSSGYNYEGIECYISYRAFTDSVPMYVLDRTDVDSHYYTTDVNYVTAKIADGYRYNGIMGYVYRDPQPGLFKLARLHQTVTAPRHYFMCIQKREYEYATVDNPSWGFVDDGNVGYVSPYGLMNPMAQNMPQGSIGGVDTGTGAFRQAFSKHGVTFHGYGPAFDLSLYYNAQSTMEFPLGPGWNHSFNTYILEGIDNNVLIKWGNGNESYFTKETDGTYAPQDGDYSTLSYDGSFTLKTKDQQTFTFTAFPCFIDNNPLITGSLMQLTSIDDRNGNRLTLERFDTGILKRAVDAAGRELVFTHNATTHRLTTVYDSQINRTLAFTYDPQGRLEHFTDARGKTTTFAYDVNDRMSTITSPKGYTQSVTYEEGMAKTTSIAGVQSLGFAYPLKDPTGCTEITDDKGNKAKHFHNPNNLVLTQVEDFERNAATLTYGDSANPTLPTSILDKRGHTTNFTYDARGNVLTITNALTKVARFAYDSLNNLTSRSEFWDSGTTGPTTSYTWTGMNLTDISDPLGHTVRVAYNGHGQPISITDPKGTTLMDYDSQGNLWHVTDGEGNITEYAYDAVSRLRAVKDALQKSTSYVYDANDNLTTVTDADLHAVNLAYDDNDNLDNISYVRGGVTDLIQYAYDDHDRLIKVTDPLGKFYSYGYYPNGDLQQKTDANGQTIQYGYDKEHRLTTTNYPGGSSVSYSYDPNGNMIGMHESWLPSAHVFTYDELNRLLSHADGYGQTVGYEYDPAGRRTRMTYPGGKVVSYSFDAASRLIGVSDWLGGNYIYSYDNADNRTSTAYPNTTSATYGYDRASRLTSIIHQKGGSAPFASYAFTLNSVGNPTSATTVDPIQPILQSLDVTYSIGQDNRLLSQTDGTSYTYDFNGNRTAKTVSGTTTNYAYDAENRLTQADSTQYVYDGLGNRVAKFDTGGTTRYVLDTMGDMADVLMETDAGGTPKAYYIQGAELLALITPAGDRYSYHGDQVGSVVAMTDSSGNIANKYAYDPFGRNLAQQGTVTNPFKYAGKYGVMDEGNGLSFMRARFYDCEAGRFLVKDPIGFAGDDYNLYAYAGNRPNILTDASGNKVNWRRVGKNAKAAGWNTVKFSFRLASVTPDLAIKLGGVIRDPKSPEAWISLGLAVANDTLIVADDSIGIRQAGRMAVGSLKDELISELQDEAVERAFGKTSPVYVDYKAAKLAKDAMDTGHRYQEWYRISFSR